MKKIYGIPFVLVAIVASMISLPLPSCVPSNASGSDDGANKISENEPSDLNEGTETKALNDYWYSGKAELTSYQLKQARYGEMHEGTAVLVFVTEPFSKSKFVKVDHPEGNDSQVSVMKLNFTKKFTTGIYPYSMMTSSFVPMDVTQGAHAVKISSSSQE